MSQKVIDLVCFGFVNVLIIARVFELDTGDF